MILSRSVTVILVLVILAFVVILVISIASSMRESMFPSDFYIILLLVFIGHDMNFLKDLLMCFLNSILSSSE